MGIISFILAIISRVKYKDKLFLIHIWVCIALTILSFILEVVVFILMFKFLKEVIEGCELPNLSNHRL